MSANRNILRNFQTALLIREACLYSNNGSVICDIKYTSAQISNLVTDMRASLCLKVLTSSKVASLASSPQVEMYLPCLE